MSVTLKYRAIGNKEFVEVGLTGDWQDDYCELSDQVPVQTVLKLAAEIIDNSPFYKDIFDSRIF